MEVDLEILLERVITSASATQLVEREAGTHVSKFLERPRMVFTWPMSWEICGRNIRNCLGVDPNDL